MIIIISGSTHSGKTLLAQRLLEKYKYPYLSIDHLKMGLIRSGNTLLTPYSSDEELTNYLWPIVREMIKTAIENNQNLIVEGCYVPYDYKKDFDYDYLKEIKEYFLIMSTEYIINNYDNIVEFANAIENRINDDVSQTELIIDNKKNLDKCIEYNLNYILIDDEYNIKL
jgi:adenylate kinase family enzyme